MTSTWLAQLSYTWNDVNGTLFGDLSLANTPILCDKNMDSQRKTTEYIIRCNKWVWLQQKHVIWYHVVIKLICHIEIRRWERKKKKKMKDFNCQTRHRRYKQIRFWLRHWFKSKYLPYLTGWWTSHLVKTSVCLCK